MSTFWVETSDDHVIELTDDILCMLPTIKAEADQGKGHIHLEKVSAKALERVLEYCRHRVKRKQPQEELMKKAKPNPDGLTVVADDNHPDCLAFDLDAFKEMKAKDELWSVVNAAYELRVLPLCDLIACRVATMIRDKSPEEIRTILNIKNDFTPEEEEAIKNENAWLEGLEQCSNVEDTDSGSWK
jgi:S-phase kinase-associated protein 1